MRERVRAVVVMDLPANWEQPRPLVIILCAFHLPNKLLSRSFFTAREWIDSMKCDVCDVELRQARRRK